MKKISLLVLVSSFCITICSCQKSPQTEVLITPFDTISVSHNNVRDKIVVISDLHLGNDLSYSETVSHLPRLEQFLNEIRHSSTVKELVIAGDMFDEWYIPTRIDAYGTGTQADFIKKTVAANKQVFDVLNGIIQDGNVKLTYVPGNHDMCFTPENINLALPGVNQARDASDKTGIGTYNPTGYPEIAIEHSHRYDFYNCLTPNANESEAPGSILPPGYFFARIAANSFTNPTTPANATKIHEVVQYYSSYEQFLKYTYYNTWKTALSYVIYVNDNFSEQIIKTNVGKFVKTYAINDIVPQNDPNTRYIDIKLYNDLFTQTNWDNRLKYNNVPVMLDIHTSISSGLDPTYIDNQARIQYFLNPLSNSRIVIFGHTHKPLISKYKNLSGKDCIYANSGTWEDKKTRNKSEVIDQDAEKMDFIVISPVMSNSKKLQVSLSQYIHGKHTRNNNMIIEL